MQVGLRSICRQATTTRGLCQMRGLRFSHSRSSLLKGTWCVLGDQQAGSLWQDGVISSSLSSRMIAAATTSFPSSLHLFGLPVSSRISSCSDARRQMAPSSTLPLQMTLVRSLQLLSLLRPPPRSLRRAASVASLTSIRILRLMLKTLSLLLQIRSRLRMPQPLPFVRCSRVLH